MITWFKDVRTILEDYVLRKLRCTSGFVTLQGKKVNPGRRAETGTFPSGLRYISSKLHVNTTEDSGSFGGGGNYVCMVKNHVGQPNNVSVQIVVNRTGTYSENSLLCVTLYRVGGNFIFCCL